MKEKIVLIGAGSSVFTRGMIIDLMDRKWEAELALVDTDPHALRVVEKLANKIIAAKNAPIRITASVDRRAVLPGATAVICTIGVGGRRAWEQDVAIPRKYGLFQPVGDTVGPGGSSRALRMIPPMVDIAKDVLDLAPKALFFNYGNPMAPICRAIRKATGAEVTGLCHGVFLTARMLAEALRVKEEEVQYTAIGMNHHTWFTEVRINGGDAMPRLHALADQVLSGLAKNSSLPICAENPFSWQLLKSFNAFPVALDRHVTEFFPQFFQCGDYYGKKLGIDAFNLEKVIADGDRIFAEMEEQATSAKPLSPEYFDQISGEHEQVIDIIESIRSDARRIYSANLPNQGQAPNLPMQAILEAPTVADASGLRHIAQAPLPSALAGTLSSRLLWVETIVEAALEGSREKFVQALILDGWVSSVQMASQLADELLSAQARHLPLFDSAKR